MITIVTSSDGVQFAVQSHNAATARFDKAAAATLTAAQLSANPDFQQVKSLEDLLAPEFVFSAPRIAGPLERRAAFKVIKGGKS